MGILEGEGMKVYMLYKKYIDSADGQYSLEDAEAYSNKEDALKRMDVLRIGTQESLNIWTLDLYEYEVKE